MALNASRAASAAADLAAPRDDMLGDRYARKTINHDMGAVKAMFTFDGAEGGA